MDAGRPCFWCVSVLAQGAQCLFLLGATSALLVVTSALLVASCATLVVTGASLSLCASWLPGTERWPVEWRRAPSSRQAAGPVDPVSPVGTVGPVAWDSCSGPFPNGGDHASLRGSLFEHKLP